MAEAEVEHFRYMFPQFSIRKLVAAAIDNLLVQEKTGSRGGKMYRYTFQVAGTSSNIKMKENDVFLLVPAELRDSTAIVKEWKITIKVVP